MEQQPGTPQRSSVNMPATLPIPGNAEFALYLVVVLFLIIVWAVNDGFDVVTALQRGIERSPSKKLKEMLYGMTSTLKSGANMNIYLKEKSVTLMADYKRKIYEFSHSLMVFVEIYLTAIVLGAIFFTVLTAIISGIAGGATDIVLLQFFLIFFFMPMISFVFIYLIRTSSPGEE